MRELHPRFFDSRFSANNLYSEQTILTRVYFQNCTLIFSLPTYFPLPNYVNTTLSSTIAMSSNIREEERYSILLPTKQQPNHPPRQLQHNTLIRLFTLSRFYRQHRPLSHSFLQRLLQQPTQSLSFSLIQHYLVATHQHTTIGTQTCSYTIGSKKVDYPLTTHRIHSNNYYKE